MRVLLSELYAFLGLNNNQYIFTYIMGLILVISGFLNIKPLLYLIVIWKPSLYETKIITLRVIAIVLGILFICIPFGDRYVFSW